MDVRSLALILLVTAFAGCLGGGDAEPSDPTPTQPVAPTTTTTTSAAPTPTAPPEPENRAPTVQLSADKATHVLGEAFTFTLDAEDADGDDLTWYFDADGDGSEEASGDQDDLPMDVEHTYEAIDEYTATLAVSDGEEGIDASVDVTVTKVPFQDFTETFEGVATGLAVPTPTADGEIENTWVEGGPIDLTFEVPAGAGRIKGDLAWDEQGLDMDVYLFDPSGTEVAFSYDPNLPTETPLGGPGEAFTYDPGRVLPAGTWTLQILPFEAYESAYTATLEVQEDLAPVTRVLSGIAPPAPDADAFACFLAGAGTSEHNVGGFIGRTYSLDPSDLYVVFWGGEADMAAAAASGIIPEGQEYLNVCASPPAVPGEYTLTIG